MKGTDRYCRSDACPQSLLRGGVTEGLARRDEVENSVRLVYLYMYIYLRERKRRFLSEEFRVQVTRLATH